MTNTIHTPLLLSQICTRWRETAFATPRLWSRLSLQFNAPPTSTPSLVQLVQAWMTRSGGCPLTVYVFWESPPFTSTHPVLDVLAAYSSRWAQMFFYMPFSAFKALSFIRGKMPLLTELSLGTVKDDTPASSSLVGKLDVFSDAPTLRSLECVNFSPLIFKFPWGKLKEIPMMAVTIDEFLDILLQTSRLEEGGFIFLDGSTFFDVHNQQLRITHDSLKSFTIMTPPWNEQVDLRNLFTQLTFPALEKLVICNLQSKFGIGFGRFLSRLRSLKTLHLRKTALTDHELAEGLQHLPNLTTLIIYSAPQHAPTVTNHLLSAMSWSSVSAGSNGVSKLRQNLLPALTWLEISIDYNVADAFLEMVRSRMLPSTPGLEKLCTLFNDSTNIDPEAPSAAAPQLMTAKERPARLENIRTRPTEELPERVYTGLAEIASFGVEISVEDLT
ncbi:hypothetical protein BKA70DRAFT_1373287 [Coprinopsis sp. MPI-PUGE-AT-0042]|nr:hypothetical protein BKA70DRAFT_1373287 [Coprinopsis sp. MPI-PUGE-AT-0042]